MSGFIISSKYNGMQFPMSNLDLSAVYISVFWCFLFCQRTITCVLEFLFSIILGAKNRKKASNVWRNRKRKRENDLKIRPNPPHGWIFCFYDQTDHGLFRKNPKRVKKKKNPRKKKRGKNLRRKRKRVLGKIFLGRLDLHSICIAKRKSQVKKNQARNLKKLLVRKKCPKSLQVPKKK